MAAVLVVQRRGAGALVALCFTWAVIARFTSKAPYFIEARMAHGVEAQPVGEQEPVG